MPVVGISVDTAEESREVAGELGIDYPLLRDEGLRVALAYGVAMDGRDIAVPAVFVIDGNQRIHWKKVGESVWDRPKVEVILEQVDALL